MGNIADGIKQYGTQQIQKDNAESDYLKTLVQDTSDFLSDFDDRVQNTVSDILPEVWVDPVETQTTPEEDDYLAHLRQQHPDATDSELRGKSVRNTFNKTEQSARSITGNIALGALNAVSTTDRVKGLDYDYIERASNPYTLDPALLSGSAAPNSEAIVARYEGLEKGDYESFSDEDKTFWNGPQAQLIRRIDANKKQHGEIKKSIEDYKTEADEYVIHTLQDYRNDEEFQKTYEEHGGGMEGLLHGLLNEAINDPAKMPVAFIENLPYMIGFAYGGAPVVATLASQKDEENVARFQEEKGRAPTTAERTRLLVDSVGSILMERFGDKYVLRGKAARAFRKINEVLPGVSRVVGGTVTEGISGGGSEAFDQDAIKQDVTKLDTFKIAKAAKEEALVGAGGGGIATVANNLESTAKYALEDEDRIPDTLRNMGVPIPEMKKQMIMGDKTLKSMPKPDLVQQSWRATAEDMDKKDVPMQEIWEKTGFMKKEDGKWRFEVDDAGAELTAEGLSVVKRRAHNANMHDYKLGNLLKHDKMYEVAPSLKDTRVRFYSGKSNSRGYYLSDNDTLYLNLNRFSAPTSGMVADDVIDLEERIENLKADPKSSDKAFPAGLKSWETNEKQVEELEKRLDKRRKAMRTRSDADLGVLLHEVQHAVQQREGFARGGSPTEFMAEITVEKMGEMYPDRDFSEESALEALNELPYEQRKELLEEIEKESQNRYHRLLGEQESNETGMTEKEGGRRGMTPEQLKGTMPGEMGTNNTYWQEPIVKDAEGPRWKMDNTQPSSMWDDKIERRIKVMFPKDERGKYIPEERLTKEEYAEFQKAQHRLEVQARMDMEEEIALRIKDATEHEGAMQSIEYGGETITDPMFIQNEEHFKEKKKALLDIINNPSTDPTSFEKARNYLFKLEDKAEQLGYKIGKKQMSEDSIADIGKTTPETIVLYRGGKMGGDVFATPREDLAKSYAGSEGYVGKIEINKEDVFYHTPDTHEDVVSGVYDQYQDLTELEGDVGLVSHPLYEKYTELIDAGKLDDAFDQYGLSPSIDNLFPFLEKQFGDFMQFDYNQLSFRDMDGVLPLIQNYILEDTGKTVIARPYDLGGEGIFMRDMGEEQLLSEGDFEYIVNTSTYNKPQETDYIRDTLINEQDKTEPKFQEDYRSSHTAPVPEGKNSLDDFSEAMPDSPNDPNFLRYYGMGGEYAAADAETLAAMKKAAGNPDAEITVYRATPNADKSINAGDWVSTSKKYAEQHGERYLEGGYDIAQMTVKASELHTDGDLHEWGYNPKETTTDDAYKADLVGEDVDFTNTSPKPIIQDSDIQVTGDSFTIENPDYSLSVIEKDDAMAVQWVRVNPDKRGAGIGTEMYELAIKDAKRRNLDLTSDDSVSESAMTIWKKLKDMGYKVNFNEEVYTQESDLGTTTITNNVGYPVVTLNTHGVLPSKSSKTPKIGAPLERKQLAYGMTQMQNDEIALAGGMRSGNSKGDETRQMYTLYNMKGMGKDYANAQEQEIGNVQLFVEDATQKIRGLVDIKIPVSKRKQGHAKEAVMALVNSEFSNKPFKIYDIKKSAYPFWKKMGVKFVGYDFKTDLTDTIAKRHRLKGDWGTVNGYIGSEADIKKEMSKKDQDYLKSLVE